MRKEELIMILFTILLVTLIVLAIVTVLGLGIAGAGIIVVFGDVIVCVLLIALIIKHFINKKKRK